MKKLLLSAIMLCFAVAVSAASPEAEKIAKQSVTLENKRVGGTLSEKQQDDIYKAYLEAYSSSEEERNKALGVANKAVKTIMTPEQVEARVAYLQERKKK